MQINPTYMLTTRVSRPLLDRPVIPAILLVILSFTLLLSLVSDVGTFVEGGAGVFFGIVALRQVVIPPSAQIRTILEYAIWGLYFAFAGALASFLIARFFSVFHATSRTRAATIPEATIGANDSGEMRFRRRIDVTPNRESRERRQIGIFVHLLLVAIWLISRLANDRQHAHDEAEYAAHAGCTITVQWSQTMISKIDQPSQAKGLSHIAASQGHPIPSPPHKIAPIPGSDFRVYRREQPIRGSSAISL